MSISTLLNKIFEKYSKKDKKEISYDEASKRTLAFFATKETTEINEKLSKRALSYCYSQVRKASRLGCFDICIEARWNDTVIDSVVSKLRENGFHISRIYSVDRRTKSFYVGWYRKNDCEEKTDTKPPTPLEIL